MPVYPNPPGERMALDLDGSVGFFVDPSGTVTQMTSLQLAALQRDDPSAGVQLPNWGGSGGFLGFLFPQPRDIDHYFFGYQGDHAPNNFQQASTSANSVTGNDGTWLSQGFYTSNGTKQSSDTPPAGLATERTTLAAPSGWTGLVGVRFGLVTNNTTATIWAVHLYGVISAGGTPNRLRFWHPTLDQPLSTTPEFLDFGDTPRGATYTKTFRVKNNSSTLTANAPAVTIGAPTDSTSITQLSEMALSGDGGTTWHTGATGDPLTLSNLAAGAISPVITVRRVKGSSSPLGTWAQRIRAAAASWS